MSKFRIKGYELELKVTKSAYERKSILFANSIIETLGKLGVGRDDIEVSLGVMGNKNLPAQVEWFYDGGYLECSCSLTRRFIDNLYLIMKLLEICVSELVSGKISKEDFLKLFREERNVKLHRRESREILGVSENEMSLEVITNAYKKLAKLHHPDRGGDVETFQNINFAHKTLKRELS
ncbi:DnaJ domain-containing protein [Candidatus Woesearchaeota archaeon]|nr:DnaJ domain-containing protein [Nanoarchaeota archaeon]MCB9370186.1 DnaJ domain-containing protein [Candidatus Woesearchaeota archaeon]